MKKIEPFIDSFEEGGATLDIQTDVDSGGVHTKVVLLKRVGRRKHFGPIEMPFGSLADLRSLQNAIDNHVTYTEKMSEEYGFCQETGRPHEFTPDLEYDITGQTVNCENCGAPEPEKKRK